jgi:leader peptidase (prepilin peptidase) / N-methyltransferase
MDVGTVAAAGAAGLLVGPVLNVLIDRVPTKAPLRGPQDGEASAPMSWLGVPAQPWLFRGGRPGADALPRRWLAVEVVTVAAFMTMATRFAGLELVAVLWLTAALVTVSVIDLQLLRIPDRITFPALAVAVPLLIAISLLRDRPDAIQAALLGAVVYFVLLLVPHLIAPHGMGFGDVKLALLMGLYLGWVGWTPGYPIAGPLRLVLYALIAGCLIGVVFGLVAQLVTRRRGAFPFGPALALGCLIVLADAANLRL